MRLSSSRAASSWSSKLRTNPTQPLARERVKREGSRGKEGRGPLPFREVIVSYLVPALHPLIQRNNDIQPAVSISPDLTVASQWHEEKVSSPWKDVIAEEILRKTTFPLAPRAIVLRRTRRRCSRMYRALNLPRSRALKMRSAGKNTAIFLARRRCARPPAIFRTIEII